MGFNLGFKGLLFFRKITTLCSKTRKEHTDALCEESHLISQCYTLCKLQQLLRCIWLIWILWLHGTQWAGVMTNNKFPQLENRLRVLTGYNFLRWLTYNLLTSTYVINMLYAAQVTAWRLAFCRLDMQTSVHCCVKQTATKISNITTCRT